MLGLQKKVSADDAKTLRVALGAWLRELREARGLSQRGLSDALGLEYYTFISQLENGRGRIPPSRYRDWAQALGKEPKVFVRKLLMHYDPEAYDLLFSDAAKENV